MRSASSSSGVQASTGGTGGGGGITSGGGGGGGGSGAGGGSGGLWSGYLRLLEAQPVGLSALVTLAPPAAPQAECMATQALNVPARARLNSPRQCEPWRLLCRCSPRRGRRRC